jgi:hypothetical protein
MSIHQDVAIEEVAVDKGDVGAVAHNDAMDALWSLEDHAFYLCPMKWFIQHSVF